MVRQAEQERERLREAHRKLEQQASEAADKVSAMEEQMRHDRSGSQQLRAELDALRSHKAQADRDLSSARQDAQTKVRLTLLHGTTAEELLVSQVMAHDATHSVTYCAGHSEYGEWASPPSLGSSCHHDRMPARPAMVSVATAALSPQKFAVASRAHGHRTNISNNRTSKYPPHNQPAAHGS